MIAYIEAQHQASQITALEESLARAREERGLLTEDVEHQLARLGRYAEEHHASPTRLPTSARRCTICSNSRTSW